MYESTYEKLHTWAPVRPAKILKCETKGKLKGDYDIGISVFDENIYIGNVILNYKKVK